MILEKKWKIMLGVLIILLIAVFILWLTRGKEKETSKEEPVLPEEVEPILLLSEDDYRSLSQKSSEPEITKLVLAPSYSLDRKDIFYFSKEDGYFYKYSLPTEKEEKLSFRKFDNVENIGWSPKKDKAILSIVEENRLKKYLFDLSTQSLLELSPKLESVIFSPNRDKIAYFYPYTALRANLCLADPNGKNWEEITSLTPVASSYLSWSPDGKKIAVSSPLVSPILEIIPEKTCMENLGDIYAVDLTTGKSIQITKGKSGGDIVWSKDGKKILYTILEDDNTSKPKLWVYNVDTQTKENLGFYGLSKYSIFQDENTIISILPKQELDVIELSANGIKEGVILEYNLETKEKKYLSKIEDEQGIQIENLSLVENKLFFTNAKDSKLYSLTLE